MMSRRKQAKPQHIGSERNPLTSIENGSSEGIHQPLDAMNSDEHDEVIGDVHVCGNCRGEFVVFADFVKHKQSCIKKQVVMIFNEGQEQMEASSKMSEKDQDTASDRSMTPESRKSVEPNYVSEGRTQQQQDEQPGRSSDQSPNPSLPPSNVSLDNLENTPYAVAQFPRESAMIPGHPDVVMIQEQLYALQQQHLHQLHMIQSIQHQINHLTAQQQRQQIQHQQLQQLQQQHNQQKQEPKDSAASQESPEPEEKTVEPKAEPAFNSNSSTATTSTIPSAPIVPVPTLHGMIHPPHILSPAGAAAASAVQQSAIEAMHAQGRLLPPLPPPFHLPNQKSPFEMLQQHANRHMPHNPLGIPPPLPYHESLLSGQHKPKPPNVSVFDPKFSADDPFFRHKCRFCHKVFGSDSALQIHIRSHTGERPYKCNICGNRFSTKGNLKVHFQRHQSRYPHIHMDVRHHPPTPPLMDQPLQPPSIHQIPMPTFPNDHAKIPNEEDMLPHRPSKSTSPRESEGSMGDVSKRYQDEDQSEMRHSNGIDRSQGGDDSDSPSTSQTGSISPNERRHILSTSPPIALSSNVFPIMTAGGIPMSTPYPLPYPAFPKMAFGQNGTMPFESSKSAAELDVIKPDTPPSLANLAEAGMRASETSKLQQLVENIEQKITDPNQCVICHRVLSCKSSLQLHYRTHTGERPFRCKICGRSFTTKGNLKTHYAVHRSKGPIRVLHDCPICEKHFSNPLVLQQHLRLHAAEGMTIPPEMEQPRLVDIKTDDEERMDNMEDIGEDNHMDVDERNDLPTPEEGEVPEDSFPEGDKPEDGTLPSEVNSPPTENHSSEARASEEDKEPDQLQSKPFMPGILGLQPVSSMANGDSSTAPSPGHSVDTKSMMSEDENRNIHMYHNHGPESITSSMAEEELDEDLRHDNDTDMSGALDLRPKGTPQENIPPHSAGDLAGYYGRDGHYLDDIKPTMTSAGLLMSVPGMPLSGRRPMRPNTTCHYCGKVFACTSALNIHYRSHTKERPFRCDVCSKGFSTKGNLKQHMLTHKIRDMPMPRYDSPNGPNSLPTSLPTSLPMSLSNLPTSLNNLPASLPGHPSHSPGHSSHSKSPVMARPISQELPLQQTTSTNSQTPPLKRSLSVSPEDSNKRTQFKHSCSVCGKQFQTNSALEIHMRTHTGEKPFRCHICSRAFTTKGNLKVHLGTHMWNGGGRRGRRIAVEPPFIVSPKEGEVFRGDIFGMHPGFAEGAFYHYPPPHLLNGFAAAAANSKANEISVIQPPASLHLQDSGSVIMRNSLAPSAESREAAYNREAERHREMILSRDEALNHEIALNREEALSREMAMNREEAMSREMAIKREEAMSREIAMNREEAMSREMALKREEVLSREMAMNREEALSREMAMTREEALNREIALNREEAFSREMALKRELAQNKEIALERSNDRTPPVAPQLSS